VTIDRWKELSFKVMGASAGGINFEAILGMTFPELADLWVEAQHW
jgi:hypothetical protein